MASAKHEEAEAFRQERDEARRLVEEQRQLREAATVEAAEARTQVREVRRAMEVAEAAHRHALSVASAEADGRAVQRASQSLSSLRSEVETEAERRVALLQEDCARRIAEARRVAETDAAAAAAAAVATSVSRDVLEGKLTSAEAEVQEAHASRERAGAATLAEREARLAAEREVEDLRRRLETARGMLDFQAAEEKALRSVSHRLADR